MSSPQTQAYDAKLTTLLEALWGDGWLSPGGEAEVALVLAGVDLTGKRVLDVGCGSGGITLLLAERFGAGEVVALDVEPEVVAAAQRRAAERGLDRRVRFEAIAPGPLTMADASFDVVFSKDAIVHIEDKHAITRELLRVLRPGGTVAMSDWMAGSDAPASPELQRYLELEGLGFGLASPDSYFAAFRAAGFEQIAYRDEQQARSRKAVDDLYEIDRELGFDQIDGPPPGKSTYRGGGSR